MELDPFEGLPAPPEPPSHEGEGEADVTPTWAPVDLTAILAGTVVTPEPRFLRRNDGVALLYPGLTHSIHGESESGKSMICQYEAANVLIKGGSVVYIDFESDPAAVVERLRMFGAEDDDIMSGFSYVQPEVSFNSTNPDMAAWQGMLRRNFDLVVIDGVTEAVTLFGFSSNDNDELTRWGRMFPRRIAEETGAAVVMVDHVVKAADGRGRYAIGGQAKLSMITGAAYTVEVEAPLGRGLRGELRLMVGKDRPGFVRGHAGPMQAGSRTQEAARIIIDSSGVDDMPDVLVNPPSRLAEDEEEGGFRPTGIMSKVSRFMESSPSRMSYSGLVNSIGGSKDATRRAIELLAAEGYLSVAAGPRNSKMYGHLRPFDG